MPPRRSQARRMDVSAHDELQELGKSKGKGKGKGKAREDNDVEEEGELKRMEGEFVRVQRRRLEATKGKNALTGAAAAAAPDRTSPPQTAILSVTTGAGVQEKLAMVQGELDQTKRRLEKAEDSLTDLLSMGSLNDEEKFYRDVLVSDKQRLVQDKLKLEDKIYKLEAEAKVPKVSTPEKKSTNEALQLVSVEDSGTWRWILSAQLKEVGSSRLLAIENAAPETYFWGSYGAFPKASIYLRVCYPEMYNQVMTHLQTSTTRSVVITGTPGIGKSSFSIYFAWRLLQDSRAQGILFTKAKDTAHLLVKNRQGLLASADHIPIRSIKPPAGETYIRLVDLVDATEPETFNFGPTIIFSSPDRKRYKQLEKEDAFLKLYMPIFTLDEMHHLRSVCFATTVAKESMLALFSVYGGIPRFVLGKLGAKRLATASPATPLAAEAAAETAGATEAAATSVSTSESLDMEFVKKHTTEADMSHMLNVLSRSEVSRVFETHGSKAAYSDASHMLVHAMPKQNDNSLCVYQFASKFVTRTILDLHRAEQIKTVMSFIHHSDKCGGSARGMWFEEICHSYIPQNGFPVLRGLPEEGAQPSTFESLQVPSFAFASMFVPSMESLEALSARSNTYFSPSISNFEAVDSFARVGEVLYMFQMTVQATHPVKSNGLKTIIEQFGRDCTSYHLVFVVPEGTEGRFKRQAYQTLNGERAKVLPSCVAQIKQWVAGVPLRPGFEEKAESPRAAK